MLRPLLRLIGLVLLALTLASPASARKKKKKRKRKAKAKVARSSEVTVPVDVGFGPALHLFTGPIQDDQTFHTGARLWIQAVVPREVIESQKHRIPRKYQKMVLSVPEIRFRPGFLILVPQTIHISPHGENVTMYGASWRLIGLGIPLIRKPVRFAPGVAIDLAYIRINGEGADMNFFRPAATVEADLEIPFSDSFLISFGWASSFYPPQRVGGPVWEWGDSEESIWHVGQAYLMLHLRFPYTTRL